MSHFLFPFWHYSFSRSAFCLCLFIGMLLYCHVYVYWPCRPVYSRPAYSFLLQPHASASRLRRCVETLDRRSLPGRLATPELMYLYPGWSPASTIDKRRQADVQASRIIYVDTTNYMTNAKHHYATKQHNHYANHHYATRQPLSMQDSHYATTGD